MGYAHGITFTRAFLGRFDGRLEEFLGDFGRALGHLVGRVALGRAVRPGQGRPEGLFDVSQTITVHVEQGWADFHADAITGAEVLVDPDLHPAGSSGSLG